MFLVVIAVSTLAQDQITTLSVHCAEYAAILQLFRVRSQLRLWHGFYFEAQGLQTAVVICAESSCGSSLHNQLQVLIALCMLFSVQNPPVPMPSKQVQLLCKPPDKHSLGL